MKILDAVLDKLEHCDNLPEVKVLVDKIPYDELRFEERGGIYYAKTDDGFVDFYAYNGPSSGLGGSIVKITMKDGTKKDLVGPWITTSHHAYIAGFPLSPEVLITDNPEYFKRGYTFTRGNVTWPVFMELAKMVNGIPGFCNNIPCMMPLVNDKPSQKYHSESRIRQFSDTDIGQKSFTIDYSPRIVNKKYWPDGSLSFTLSTGQTHVGKKQHINKMLQRYGVVV